MRSDFNQCDQRCKLTDHHYGHCSEYEHAIFVTVEDNGTIKVIFEEPLLKFRAYSDDISSEYQRVYRPIHDYWKDKAIKLSFQKGGWPWIRQHAHNIDGLLHEFACYEIDDHRDIAIQTPIGEFRFKCIRASKGDQTSTRTFAFNGQAMGIGQIALDDVPLPVRINGLFWVNKDGTYWFQPSHIIYADETHSGFLGCYPVDVMPHK